MKMLILFQGGPMDGKTREIETPPVQFVRAADWQDGHAVEAHYEEDKRYWCTDGFRIFKYVDGPAA